ncbi:MAG: CCDC90 family protein [Planctomycetota bacterium]|jgi:hypothetical protein|nr:CCDC90 family protein [Planctomycetota bacterium]
MLTMPLSFDALDWLAQFKAAGFSERQAKVQIAVIEKAVAVVVEATEKKISDNRLLDEKTRQELATKGDLEIESTKIRAEIDKLRAETDVKLAQIEAKIERIKADLELKIEKLRNSLVMWLVGGFITQTALLLTVLQWR